MVSNEEPWKDKETLEELYWDDGLSQSEIGEELGTTQGTIAYWFDKFDIDTREFKEACKGNNRVERCSFRMSETGHIVVYAFNRTQENDGVMETKQAHIHQLIEIAKGEDPHKIFSNGEYEVHHINKIPWDNRPDNTVLLTYEEHKLVTFMEKVDVEQVLKAADIAGVEI